MLCNCIKDTEKKLLSKVSEISKFKNSDEKVKVTASNMAYIFDSKEGSMPFQEFEATQNYTTKTGKVRTNKESFQLLFNFCPYCGRKLEK
ncbi:hypothetical protein [Clostridium culturomicium]|uniref:hypothetical protein n=1 Tax=Clostridium culturomicium TaxID=1499683 RepID=UPI0038578DBB